MIKHTLTIHRLLSTNCLSVFDHYVGLALKGLIVTIFKIAFNLVRLHFKLLNEFQHQCYIGLRKIQNFSTMLDRIVYLQLKKWNLLLILVYGVFSGPYFTYSVRMRENTDQKNLCIYLFTLYLQLTVYKNSRLKSTIKLYSNTNNSIHAR